MVDDEWVFACRLHELNEREGIRVKVTSPAKRDKDYELGLWRCGSRVYALDNKCCHKNASLHRGDIEDLGLCIVDQRGGEGVGGVSVRCPKHQRKFGGGLYFNLETGKARQPQYTSHFRDLKSHHVRAHKVRVGDNGNVYVSLDSKEKGMPAVAESHQQGEGANSHAKTKYSGASSARASETSLERTSSGQHQRKDYANEEQRLHATISLMLQGRKRLNHDTGIFVFVQSDECRIPQPPPSPVWHVSILALIDGEIVDREYTPLSSWQEWAERRVLRLLIKVYPDGVMTQYLARLQVGASVQVTAPVATINVPSFLPPPFRTTGKAEIQGSPPEHLVLIAGGTGIMPMLQILREIFVHGSSYPSLRSCVLVYSNKTSEDLLCWQQVCEIERQRLTRSKSKMFKVVLAFTSPAQVASGSAEVGLEGVPVVRGKRVDWPDLTEVIHPIFAQDTSRLREKQRVRVIISGPTGLFRTMRNMFPYAFREQCTWIDLDE